MVLVMSRAVVAVLRMVTGLGDSLDDVDRVLPGVADVADAAEACRRYAGRAETGRDAARALGIGAPARIPIPWMSPRSSRVRAILSLRLSSVFAALLAACALLGGAGRAAASSPDPQTPACNSSGYAYAGYEGSRSAGGVAATITEIEPTSVSQGQVLAWVGAGSEDGGPGGKPEWIQAGLIAFPGQAAQLYYEIMKPGLGWKRTLFGNPLAPGESHRIAVVEVSRNHWRVLVDSRPVSPVVLLPRSHGAWVPDAVVESYKSDPQACNSFNFRFQNIGFRSGGSRWTSARPVSVLADDGASITRLVSGFDAVARF
jgi:hypothetical protein